MSAPDGEPSVVERVDERPSLKLGALKETRVRHVAYRFVAGALTSVVAGALATIFSPRVGGVMLAFPAILAASLTLIEDEEAAADAREDARGAIAGAFGLAVFAAVGALALTRLAGSVSLLLAAAGWTVAAAGAYLVLWWK